MAPTQHLEWVKLDRFGGLWDNGAPISMPPNMAQVMSGCYPQPAGGIRAFFRPIPFAVSSGFSNSGSGGAPFRIIGVHGLDDGNLAVITADVDTTAFPTAYTKLARDAQLNLQAYTLDAPGSGFTALAAEFAGQDLTGPAYTTITSQMAATIAPDTGQTVGNYIGIRRVDDTTKLYSVDVTNGYVGQDPNEVLAATGLVEVHQNRLIINHGRSILFSTQGEWDFPAAGDIASEATAGNLGFITFSGGDVSRILPLPPSDLLVSCADGAIYNVQGPVDDPIVRMVFPPGTPPTGPLIRTSKGLAATASEGPRFLSLDGSTRLFGQTLDQRHWALWLPTSHQDDNGGDLGTAQKFANLIESRDFIFAASDLFTQNKTQPYDVGHLAADAADVNAWYEANELRLNGSLVYDPQTNAWFKSAHPDVAQMPGPYAHAFYPTVSEGVITLHQTELDTGTTDDVVAYVTPTFGQRADTWEWRSAPFHSEDGRQVELRELSFGVYAYESLHEGTGLPTNPPASTVTVWATNEFGETTATKTLTLEGGRQQVLTVPLGLKGTYVDVSVKAESPHPDVEAPTLEYINIGFTRGAHVRKNYQ